MGIRFACHGCGKPLNIKQDLAGKRGVCPGCAIKFRIPFEDAPQSSPVVEKVASPVAAQAEAASAVADASESAVATIEAETVAPQVEPDFVMDDPEATWYVRPPSGGQYGPATVDVLRQWIDEGRVAATALLWRDGWPQWRSASETLPGLSKRLPSTGTGNSNGHTDNAGSASSDSRSSDSRSPDSRIPDSRSPIAPGVVSEVASNVADSPSASPSMAAPATQAGEAPSLTGRAEVGTVRRERNVRQVMFILLLALVAIVLLGALIYLMVR